MTLSDIIDISALSLPAKGGPGELDSLRSSSSDCLVEMLPLKWVGGSGLGLGVGQADLLLTTVDVHNAPGP